MRTPLKELNFHQRSSLERRPHAGLVLDCCYPIGSDQSDRQKELFDGLSRLKNPDYQSFLERWRKFLNEYPETEIREAPSLGRMVIGLGNETVSETGIALHHTYGVPFLPGSALKGLAAMYARNHLDGWDLESEGYRTLFGFSDENEQSMGMVVFHDALPVEYALHPDVIAVHHPKYYQGGDDAPPADWDNPIPVSFLAASGKFVLALSGPEAWRTAAFDILSLALKEEGIGGKTSSGYGRLQVEIPKLMLELDGLLEAVVARIDGNKVTYQFAGQKKTVKEPKHAAALAEGKTVTVRVEALNDDGSVKSVKLAR